MIVARDVAKGKVLGGVAFRGIFPLILSFWAYCYSFLGSYKRDWIIWGFEPRKLPLNMPHYSCQFHFNIYKESHYTTVLYPTRSQLVPCQQISPAYSSFSTNIYCLSHICRLQLRKDPWTKITNV